MLGRLSVAHLGLIDLDCIGLHNCGEGIGYGTKDIGRPKVEALGDYLR